MFIWDLFVSFLVPAGLFECFHNPLNSCIDYKIVVSEEMVVYVVRMTWKWFRMGADLNNFLAACHVYAGSCWWCAAAVDAMADIHKLFLIQQHMIQQQILSVLC